MGRRIDTSRDWRVLTRWFATIVLGLLGAMFCGAGIGTTGVRAAEGTASKSSDRQLAQGRELFEREWIAGDSRSHGGDGLGPVYNDTSCVACHNLGGAGGGGAASKNVNIVTATPNGGASQGSTPSQDEPGFLARALGSLFGLGTADETKPKPGRTAASTKTGKNSAARKLDTRELVKAHPGFRTARSVVLHRFGVKGDYESWRQSLLGFAGGSPLPQMDRRDREMFQAQNALNFGRGQTQSMIGQFVVVSSQRNAIALFGAGLVDAIPDRVIEQAAQIKHAGFPEIAGRVSRLKDKRIGRFGWKAQTASLPDFVLTACAVELGLEVPGHHQGGSPQKPAAKAKGLDLTAGECSALVSYVRGLPKPAERKPATDNESREIVAGRALFTKVGCATCHASKLGDVEGLYSDLLLHDLGQQLGDTGQYAVFDPSSSEDEIIDEQGPIADATSAVAPVEPEAAEIAAAPPAEAAIVATAPVPAPPTLDVTGPIPPGAAGAAAMEMAFQRDKEMAFQRDVSEVRLVRVQAGPAKMKRPTTGPASRFEWRTPPLWGFRDSGPYLHDGRAETLGQAVALHGGESATIARNFFGLSAKERRQVEAFLKSLTAPASAELVASAK
jgi:CxxC motif-containing protein (DUF1111 family)